jgi:hypothetical protein
MNDKDNRAYYNRTHFFGTEDIKEYEDFLDELDNLEIENDDDEDDFDLTENF